MKGNQKILLTLILVCIIGLIVSSISFSYLSNNNYDEITTLTTKTTNKKITTNTSEQSVTNKTTTKNIETTKPKSKTTTIKNKDNIGIIEEYEKKVYYYTFTDDEYRDYTGRNCFFIYDMEGNTVDGYANFLYYKKYKKKQFITKDTTKCFLEDKQSVIVESIIVDGVKYE